MSSKRPIAKPALSTAKLSDTEYKEAITQKEKILREFFYTIDEQFKYENKGHRPFIDAFSQLGEYVIPNLRAGVYSSIVLDANAGLLPGQVFRAWRSRLAEEGGPRIPVTAIRASRHLERKTIWDAVNASRNRIGDHPLIVTDHIQRGTTIQTLVEGMANADVGREITIASIGMLGEKDDVQRRFDIASRKYLGNRKITILPPSRDLQINELLQGIGMEERPLDKFRYDRFPVEAQHVGSPAWRGRAWAWHGVNEAMRNLGRAIWDSAPHDSPLQQETGGKHQLHASGAGNLPLTFNDPSRQPPRSPAQDPTLS